jgi:murein DD-endopeptidase MepM/ murein hydrolase activator NlpD
MLQTLRSEGRHLSALRRLAGHAAFLALTIVLLAAEYPQIVQRASPVPSGDGTRVLEPSSRGGASSAYAFLSSEVSSIRNGAGLRLSRWQGAYLDIQAPAVPTKTLPAIAPAVTPAAVVPTATPPSPLPTATLPPAQKMPPPLANDGNLFKVPVPQTTIPKRPRKEVITYTIQPGDNLSTIAERFDVDVDSLIWANGELDADPDYLLIGDQLLIPPTVGVLYRAKTGDTLEALVKQFKGDLKATQELEYNKIVAPAAIMSGTLIMVPGGEKPYPPRLVYIGGKAVVVNAPVGSGRFAWPTTGYISTFFGPTHGGIDIAGPLGTPIYAADAGVVVFAGWNGGYGNCVIIDHGNGVETVYGHFYVFYPQVGMNVRRGQAIGKMGSTGNSTGPHLHFEIRRGGVVVDPLKYLPQ